MRFWKPLLGLGIAAFLIWWLFRNENPEEVWSRIRGADVVLLSLAVAVTTAGFAVRAVRWRFYLAPVQPRSPFRSRFAAVCTGFMANNLLPTGRVGEFARAFAYSRLEPVSATSAFATLVVERFMDGVAILILLFVAVGSPGFPADALPGPVVQGIRTVSLLLGLILAGTVLLIFFPGGSVEVFRRVAKRRLSARRAASLVAAMTGFVEGLASLRGWRLFLPALLWSLGLWALQSLSFWIGFLAFDIRLPYTAALFTNATIALAVTVPAAPGYFGTLQAGAKIALVNVYGVATAPALGFAVGWHLGSFFPITLMGLWYARRLGVSLKDISGQGSSGRNRPGADLP